MCVGDAFRNQRYSEDRAKSFRRMLDRCGVYNPVETLGLSMEYLIADDKGNKDSPAAQRNRRVDVYIAR